MGVLKPCPDCNGSGVYLEYDEYDRYTVHHCATCDGSGEITRRSVKSEEVAEYSVRCGICSAHNGERCCGAKNTEERATIPMMDIDGIDPRTVVDGLGTRT